MRNIFVTADLHFGHKNIMTFCPNTRGHFKDVDHMNEEMVREWNDTVGPEDLTYILGDVAFMQANAAANMVNRLNGTKILVEGNHDRKALKDVTFQACFAEVHKYLDITHNGNKVVMFHYPIAEWDQMHRGAIHIHGHVHGNKTGLEKFRAFDAGMDARGTVVTRLDDIIAEAMKRAIKGHHVKE